jgi:hypothetical protein
MQRCKTVATSGWDIVSEQKEMEGNESSKKYSLPDGYTKPHPLDKIALHRGEKWDVRGGATLLYP